MDPHACLEYVAKQFADMKVRSNMNETQSHWAWKFAFTFSRVVSGVDDLIRRGKSYKQAVKRAMQKSIPIVYVTTTHRSVSKSK